MVFLYALLGIIGWEAWKKILDQIENPFRWKCPEKDCSFKFKCNDKGLHDRVKGEHIQTTGHTSQ